MVSPDSGGICWLAGVTIGVMVSPDSRGIAGVSWLLHWVVTRSVTIASTISVITAGGRGESIALGGDVVAQDCDSCDEGDLALKVEMNKTQLKRRSRTKKVKMVVGRNSPRGQPNCWTVVRKREM